MTRKVSSMPRSSAAHDVLERSIVGIANAHGELERLAAAGANRVGVRAKDRPGSRPPLRGAIHGRLGAWRTAAEGVEPLRRYLGRTRMIYNLCIGDLVIRDRIGAAAESGSLQGRRARRPQQHAPGSLSSRTDAILRRSRAAGGRNHTTKYRIRRNCTPAPADHQYCRRQDLLTIRLGIRIAPVWAAQTEP
jgi:hypothetical protein